MDDATKQRLLEMCRLGAIVECLDARGSVLMQGCVLGRPLPAYCYEKTRMAIPPATRTLRYRPDRCALLVGPEAIDVPHDANQNETPGHR